MKSSLFIVLLLSLGSFVLATKKTGQKKDITLLLLQKITHSLHQKNGIEAKAVLALISAHSAVQNIEKNKIMFPFTKEFFDKLAELVKLSPQEYEMLDKLWIK